MTLLRLAVRLGRVGALMSGLIGAIAAIAQPLAFAQLRGNTAQERAIFAQQMALLARQFTYILPVPHDLGTMAGWIEWRAIGILEIIFAVWAVMAATGAGRGDEERGLVEHWLAQGLSRGRYIASRIVAFAVLAALVSAVALGGAGVGSAIASDPVAPAPLALQAIALLGLVLCCYALGLLGSQLVLTRRGAITLGGGVLLALYLVNVAARSGGAEDIRWISPFWLYDQNHPLTNGGSLDVPRTLALYASAVVFAGLAVVAFVRRDLGGAFVRLPPSDARPTAEPSRDPFLRVPVLALLDQQRVAIATWAVVLAALSLFFLSFTRTVVDTMLATPTFRVYIERAGLASYTSFIGVVWFTTLVLILSIYAIVHASGWAADDQEGRLELVLSQPVSRTRIVLERLAALLGGAAIVVTASAIALAVAAASTAIAVDNGRLALASALTLAVVFAFGGLGALGVGWRPRLAVVALGVVAIFSYFDVQLAPLFDWPDWVENLSIYALYGDPMTADADWPKIAALVATGALASVVSLYAFQRRDVGA
jgi:ABC-2 type transport system permease protein